MFFSPMPIFLNIKEAVTNSKIHKQWLKSWTWTCSCLILLKIRTCCSDDVRFTKCSPLLLQPQWDCRHATASFTSLRIFSSWSSTEGKWNSVECWHTSMSSESEDKDRKFQQCWINKWSLIFVTLLSKLMKEQCFVAASSSSLIDLPGH